MTNATDTVKSLYNSQEELLEGIYKLHCPNGFEVDASYGNGSFYKGSSRVPPKRFDIDSTLDNCEVADSENLPLEDSSVSSLVFDPPFLTYVRQNRVGNGNMIMSKRFSGYWTYHDLESHYKGSLREFKRVIKKKGVVVFKCQDIVHNHRLHPTHINVINWADGFRLKDLFILSANHRLPSPNRKGKQKHARVFHSYFLVLQRE